jgi:hypothetical protein
MAVIDTHHELVTQTCAITERTGNDELVTQTCLKSEQTSNLMLPRADVTAGSGCNGYCGLVLWVVTAVGRGRLDKIIIHRVYKT